MRSRGDSRGNVKINCLTKLEAFSEAIEALGNVFYGANVYNTLYELYTGHENEDPLGWPLYIGIALGIISLESAFTHYRYQHVSRPDQATHSHAESHTHENDSEDEGHETAYEMLDDPLTTSPVHSLNENKEVTEEKPHKKGLTFFQKVHMVTDGISRVCGRAGELYGLISGVPDTFANTTLPVRVQAWSLFGATVVGLGTSASGIQACYNTMIEKNQRDFEHQQQNSRRGPRQV